MAVPLRRSGTRRRTRAGQTFGKNLRCTCDTQGIDAARLAELMGRSRGSIERMLAGEGNPTLSFLEQVAHSIDVPLVDLVRGV
jgi:transcriptional regulator with XRE-family HTH domain